MWFDRDLRSFPDGGLPGDASDDATPAEYAERHRRRRTMEWDPVSGTEREQEYPRVGRVMKDRDRGSLSSWLLHEWLVVRLRQVSGAVRAIAGDAAGTNASGSVNCRLSVLVRASGDGSESGEGMPEFRRSSKPSGLPSSSLYSNQQQLTANSAVLAGSPLGDAVSRVRVGVRNATVTKRTTAPSLNGAVGVATRLRVPSRVHA